MEEEEVKAVEVTEREPEVVEETVSIDIVVNDTRYAGEVKLKFYKDTGICELDTSALGDVNSEEWMTWNDSYITPVINILKWEARAKAINPLIGQNMSLCEITNYWAPDTRIVRLHDGRNAFSDITRIYDDEYYLISEGTRHHYRDADGTSQFWAPQSFWDAQCYCHRCGEYINPDLYDYDHDMCRQCWRENHRVIEGYGESHDHNENPLLFGDYKDREHFAGMGFELEVDCNEEQEEENEDVAQNLISACSLEDNEVRFAHDGSLNYGFEIISEPHTVKAFWDKAPQWRQMLSYLSRNGYTSHDAGTCGLHIHVSRRMFGNTEAAQESAIAKIYMFFDDNWSDIVKVSRRNDFEYCDKNNREINYSDENNFRMSEYDKWKKHAKNKSGCHYVALNNSNTNTFEYRLGRGTLNAWSFFSWVDFILTITKNAKRITVQKVESNDLMSWLAGIKESTAKYMYKRGAFRKEVLTLYPSIEWETDLNDRG